MKPITTSYIKLLTLFIILLMSFPAAAQILGMGDLKRYSSLGSIPNGGSFLSASDGKAYITDYAVGQTTALGQGSAGDTATWVYTGPSRSFTTDVVYRVVVIDGDGNEIGCWVSPNNNCNITQVHYQTVHIEIASVMTREDLGP